VSDWLLIKLAQHQLEDFWSLQLSSVAFFWLCAINMLVTRRWSLKLAPDQVTDMFYWLLMPQVRVISRMVAVVVVLGLALAFGVQLDAARFDGFGPVARQPKALIIVELFVLMDFATYWSHRMFHTVPFLWRFHALHHSAKRIRWSTTGRVHPVNELVNYLATVVPYTLLGFPISAILPVAPVVIAFALFAHSEMTTAYGPFSGILVSPRFHRWHHTHSHEGGNKNFANVFAFWDRLFGTYYLPEGRLPETFGLDVDDVPTNYLGQLRYPWQRPKTGSVAAHETLGAVPAQAPLHELDARHDAE
jgi:sterol desaturase/sphingolipid hydroxylase (fatty acid hydroxylase superfamily)